MLPIFTAKEMAELDRRVIEGFGIPGMVLMESAARGVFRAALRILYEEYGAAIPIFDFSPGTEEELDCGCDGEYFDDLPANNIAYGRRIKVYCGKGNNGGDGLAVARMLDSVGAEVEIVLLARGEDLTGDARTNYELAVKLEIPIVEEARGEELCVPDGCHLVIDALLGTGITGAARGTIAEAIEEINDAPCPVLAVDIPSGVEGSTGNAEGPAVSADATVTMAALKRGLVFSPGRELAGVVSIVDIGAPEKVVREYKPYLWQVEAHDVLEMLPVRAEDAHKGECGRVFIIAGSRGLTGAACMSAQACVKSGAGLVVLGLPQSLNHIAEIKLTEAMSVPLPETTDGSLAADALDEIRRRLEWANACVIGPGLSRKEETLELARNIIAGLKIPAVIDADALFALAGHSDLLTNLPENTILTPHLGEFARLVNLSPDEVRENRIGIAREKAAEWNCVILLKGAPTLTASPDGTVYLNSTGNSGMATGGVGDVLSGVLAALLGQGATPVAAAAAGAFIHGLAGDFVAEDEGLFSLAATDITFNLGQAFGMFGC